MRYLVAVDNCFPDLPNGIARVAWDIATMMRDAGHEVAMVCGCVPGSSAAPGVEELNGLRIVRYARPPVASWLPIWPWLSAQAMAAATRSHLGDVGWDVAHLHAPFTGAGAIGALGRRPRFVYTMHSPVVPELQVRWAREGIRGRVKARLGLGTISRIERRVLDACETIHTLSQYTRGEVVRRHGLGHKVVVIPHWRRAQDARTFDKGEARRRLGWPQGEPILFTVRGHEPRYGLDVAIEAVAPLAAEGRCRMMIGGDGSMRASLERLARDLGVADRILFAGRLSDADLALCYQAADLFILPTLALECFGLILLEALSYGCPILATDAGAIAEILRPILPQFIVPSGDVAALRSGVRRFLDRALVPPSPDVLVRYVSDRFGHETVVPRLRELLETPRHGE